MAWDRACDIVLNSVLKVRPNENLVIVADEASQLVAEALHERAREAHLDSTLCLMGRRTKPAEEPPAAIAAAMLAADCAVLATTQSITHSRARHAAMNAGVRIASMPGASARMFEDGSLEADVNLTQPLGLWIADQITAADEARITSPLGTDLRMSIKGRRGGGSYGVADVAGAFTVTPCLESTVGPVEWTAEGTLVVDGVVVPGGMVKQPFEIVFEKGTVKTIGDGPDAAAFQSMMEGYGDPNVYHVAELGIGLNPRAQMGFGIMAEDEGVYGTIHIGLGEGRSFGSSITAITHTDLVLLTGQITLDGKVILDQREFAFTPPADSTH
jgi:leucyl aminopeptidase (aminopeptidase T)